METDLAIISETDVKGILEANVPGLKIGQSREGSLTKIINGFADYTIDLIKKGNLSAIKTSFNTAENLLAEGSSEVKHAIENIYVFSITIFFDTANAVSRQVKELLPTHLNEEYHKQINSCRP
jgi:hypothetical protein